jgi:hypothetical protein
MEIIAYVFFILSLWTIIISDSFREYIAGLSFFSTSILLYLANLKKTFNYAISEFDIFSVYLVSVLLPMSVLFLVKGRIKNDKISEMDK